MATPPPQLSADARHLRRPYATAEPLYQWGSFSFGQNAYGELGHGDVHDRAAPTRIDELQLDAGEIVDVACGNEQTTLLSADGHVYACGYNDSGQCGTASVERALRPLRIAALDDKKIARVFSGNGSEHVAVLTATGALYTFGFNSRGQLGHGTTTTSVAVPTLVQDLVGKSVVDVACSYFHTVIVTAEGELFACGRNDFGQLGTGDGIDRSAPTFVASLRGQLVRAVSCGQHHTVVAVAAGGLYAWGKNDHGQLGIGDTTDPVREPARVIGELEHASITRLACGYYHTVAVTEHGAVFSFGRNDYGQLGLGHKRHVSTPAALVALARVRMVDVACGCYHTLALSDDGKVYPFGRNNHGQLGLDSSVDCLTPQIIPTLRDVVVRKVAAGFYHSVCLASSPTSASAMASERTPTLSSDLRRMFNNPTRSDVTFVVEGVPLHAHSCILMARCEPLEKMLDGRTKDSSLSQIDVPNSSHEAFSALLEFLYTDDVPALTTSDVDVEFLLELVSLADQYLVHVLQRRCEDALERLMSAQNVCGLLESAHLRESFRLKQRCLSFILDHFSDVIPTQAFISLPPPLLQEVLRTAARHGVTIPNQNRPTNIRT